MYFLRSISIVPPLLTPLFVHAQNTLYTNPLTRIPGITDAQTLSNISTYGLAGFLNGLITFLFTAAAIASVVMIVIIGFQYATTERSGPNIGFLKGKMTSVALGVAIVASMYIVFRFINPEIINTLNVFGASKNLTPVAAETFEQTPGTGGGGSGDSGGGSGDSGESDDDYFYQTFTTYAEAEYYAAHCRYDGVRGQIITATLMGAPYYKVDCRGLSN